MSLQSKEYALNDAAIDEIAEDLRRFLEQEKGVERHSVLRTRLTAEELLYALAREDGIESCTIFTGRRLGRPCILLRYGGAAFDPTRGAADDWSGQLLANLGLSPEWTYRAGVNTVTLRPPRKGGMGRLAALLIAVLAAALLGAAGAWLPETLRAALTEHLLAPVFQTFLGLLNTFAGLMIFLTVAAGIFGIGDTASLNRVGRTMFPRYLATAFIVSAITLFITRPFFDLNFASAQMGESQLGAVAEMLFAILPRNFIQPFLDGNTLQVIVLAIFTGAVLLMLGKRAQHAAQIIEEFGTVFQTMMEQVCRLIPLFVFVSLVRQIWSGAAGTLLGLWKPFCMVVALCAVCTGLLLLFTCMRVNASPALVLKKVFPAFAVAFTTASSMAAFPVSVEACDQKMGIDRRLAEFAFPVGVVIYMPAGVVGFAVLSGYLAEVYAVEVDAAWFVMAWLLAAVLSVAVPPMPGAMLTCYGILFAQLGIPPEGLLLAAAVDVVLDFFMTGFDILMLQIELINEGALLGMLDREKLRAQNSGD